MEPAFMEFDRVLTFNFGALQQGSVVVLNFRGKIYLKRIVKINKEKIYVGGDNKKLSSRIGPVTKADIIGRVFLKY